MPDVRITLELEGEGVDLRTYHETVRELRAALADVEQTLTHRAPSIVWRFDDDAVLRAVASPDGAGEDTLMRIVRDVRAGFQSLVEAAGHPVRWPESFGERAKRAIKGIVKQLDRLDTITVGTEDADPITIDRAVIRDEVVGRAPGWYIEVSSIDGMLDLISVRGRPHFGIEEHGTGRRVRCIFPEEMFETVKKALGRRVVVEGLVKCRADGTPISVVDARSVWVRPDELPIENIVGSLPDFTGGLSAGEYVRRMRAGEDAP